MFVVAFWIFGDLTLQFLVFFSLFYLFRVRGGGGGPGGTRYCKTWFPRGEAGRKERERPSLHLTMTLRMRASLSSSWPTILTKGKAELFAAAASSVAAEAFTRIALTRELEEEPAVARGFTTRGVPAMKEDVMDDIVSLVLFCFV